MGNTRKTDLCVCVFQVCSINVSKFLTVFGLEKPSRRLLEGLHCVLAGLILDAESRPAFKELAEEFSRMMQDSKRYIAIPV
jgi:hypothetical protein